MKTRHSSAKNTIRVLSILILVPTFVYAAENNKTSDITFPVELLGNRNSPAATILDVSPEIISRPNSPQDIVTTLSTATGNYKSFPSLLNVEISPLWLFSGDTISYSQYRKDDPWENLKQGSISCAAKTETIDEKAVNSVSAGLYIPLFKGNLDKTFTDTQDGLLEIGELYNTERHKIREEVTKEFDANGQNIFDAAVNDEIDKEVQKRLNASYATKIAELAKSLKWQRQGFLWNISGAASTSYYKNTYLNNKALGMISGWSTLGFDNVNKNSYLGILRYSKNYIDPAKTCFDGGLKAIIGITNASFSLEAIHKYYNEEKVQHDKISIGMVFRGNDKIKIPISFGMEFAKNYIADSVSVNLDAGFGGDFSFIQK